jgi:alpha-L-arabinofuranosidase
MFAQNQGTVSLPVKIENSPTFKTPVSAGCIGLGTWNNAAEFKDVKVIDPDGKVLFESDFSKNIDSWRKTGRGEWSVHDGILRQSAITPGVTAFIGDTTWTDYTITLKACKLHGENGFQIYFHNKNNRQRIRWDLGGYTNSVHMMEIGLITESMEAAIEAGKWYDVKLEIRGSSAKGYLDGKLVQQVAEEKTKVNSLCVSAARDDKSGDIILKIVNADPDKIETKIDLKGAGSLTGNGKAIVLASESPLDENTLDEPTKVCPKNEEAKIQGNIITRTFPGNSFTIIRIPTSGEKK